jgi:nucleotide-binding universal stress UspA family protein
MVIPTCAGPRSTMGGIVVGVDGSTGSLAALRWAIRGASARGEAVYAVTAWEVPMESTFGDVATIGDFHPVTGAERILVAALADAGAADADVTVTTARSRGTPPRC